MCPGLQEGGYLGGKLLEDMFYAVFAGACVFWTLEAGCTKGSDFSNGVLLFKDGSLEGSFGSLKSWILPGPTVVTS